MTIHRNQKYHVVKNPGNAPQATLVFSGTPTEIDKWASEQGYAWEEVPDYAFGGFFRDENHNLFVPIP